MIYQDYTDETLVMLTLAGEQRAYEVLVVRYQSAVISSAAAITRNHFMAEDAAQDAFVTAWMKLDTLSEPKKYGAWVCRIAKNCAINMLSRFRSFIPFDMVDNQHIFADNGEDPAVIYSRKEENEELYDSIDKLPKKVKEIINLHYFEGLSIAEIAHRMNISEGTVKWQLHDGRKRIRKDICAMNEKIDDTLVQRVMKKVEELKLWQSKNSKNGFEKVYEDVLGEVESLPECKDKYHALADVLMRGWWWIPGKKNDALFEKIKEAAELGKNDEVMEFIVAREDEKLYGKAKLEFIRDKQVPRLEKAGFVKALGYEWYWLGRTYFSDYHNVKDTDKGFEAYEKALSILSPSDKYYAAAVAAIAREKRLIAEFSDKNSKRYYLIAAHSEFRITGGTPCFTSLDWTSQGALYSVDVNMNFVFRNASYCDGNFYVDGMAKGNTYTGSDGTTLTFEDNGISVQTPCGRFDDCQLWITRYKADKILTYFKEGIGIVKQEKTADGVLDVRLLSGYEIKGGKGLLPCYSGNRWEYTAEYPEDILRQSASFVMLYADNDRAVVYGNCHYERLKYDETSWLDAILEIRTEYWQEVNGRHKIHDVYEAIERAERLAVTPMQKAHSKAACSVARRILETDTTFNPDGKATGHWNFFNLSRAYKYNGSVLCSDHNSKYGFEWKNTDSENAMTPLLYNDIYGILKDATDCLWSDEWVAKTESTAEFILWNHYPIKTKIVYESCPDITTAAGSFSDCIKLSLDIGGLEKEAGLKYRGGKKEYYFARGVGIVRTVNEFFHGALKAVYELTAYEGTGEGYMPIEDGMMRRYDAIGLTDGYVASAVYTYVADEDGQISIFADRCGIRERNYDITSYAYILDEVTEDKLWEENKRDESRARHAINNFNILLHFLFRNNRTHAAPWKNVEWNKYRIRFVENMLTENGEIPRAWLGAYADMHFVVACSSFGCKDEAQKEEGYIFLEKAFELYPRWLDIPDGELLEVGNKGIYGDIRIPKGKDYIVLPDESKEALTDYWNFKLSADRMYYSMTAPRDWEWFNPVRKEDRFNEYVERARKLMEKYK